jgi:hypothetical protein
MASFKVRRNSLLNGGVTIPTGTINSIAGSTTLAGNLDITAAVAQTGTVTHTGSTNFSASAKFSSSAQFGTLGTAFTKIITGSAIITSPSMTAGSSASSLITIANVATGDFVFATAGSLPIYAELIGAYATAASVVTARFFNSGSVGASEAAVTLQYFIIRK